MSEFATEKSPEIVDLEEKLREVTGGQTVDAPSPSVLPEVERMRERLREMHDKATAPPPASEWGTPPPAANEPIKASHVDYGGHTYEINPAGANSLELVEAMQDEDIIGALKIAFTPDAYKQARVDLKDPDTGFTSIDTFTKFLEAFAAAVRPTEKQQSS